MKMKCKVVGLGGIGRALVDPLARFLAFQHEWDSELHLIDGDNYSEQNRSRQAFRRLGNKALVTADALRDEFEKRIWISTTQDYLNETNANLLIRDGDVVFGCVDNYATRKLLNDVCMKRQDIVLISGGNEFTDGNVQVLVRKKGVCLTRPLTDFHPEIQKPPDHIPGQRREGSCEEQQESSPQLLFANHYAVSLMLAAFYGWLQGVFDDGEKKYVEVVFDLLCNLAVTKERSKKGGGTTSAAAPAGAT